MSSFSPSRYVRARSIFSAALLAVPSLLLGNQSSLQSGGSQTEDQFISNAHAAAERDDDVSVDSCLRGPQKDGSKEAPSVVLSRRAAILACWLRNDQSYPKAINVAKRALKLLGAMTESTDRDRVERLYWESILQGEILNNRPQALALLEKARKLAPDDDRLLEEELKWLGAITSFGS